MEKDTDCKKDKQMGEGAKKIEPAERADYEIPEDIEQALWTSLSEKTLKRVWENEEEDEAWKDL